MRLGEAVTAQIMRYELGDSTIVQFEGEPSPGFHPAGREEILGSVEQAIAPAVDAAKAVLDKFKEARPDQAELRFGVKVSGGATWLVAKCAAEANFEICLTWLRDHHAANDGAE
jgi:hypothetical protein